MAKIIAPPEIHDLDGLLELVLHPEKGIAYLKALQELRDSITATLGLLTTKALADEHLAIAGGKMQEALEASTMAQEIESETKAKCATMLSETQAKVDFHEQTMTGALAQLAKSQADVTKREGEASRELAEAAQQSLFNRNFQATLDRRKQELDEREAKLSKLKVAIGEAVS